MISAEVDHDYSEPVDEALHEPTIIETSTQPVQNNPELLITHSGLREITNTRNQSMRRERIARLMLYAFYAKDETGEVVQTEPVVNPIDDPASFVTEWIANNFERIENVIGDPFEMKWHNEDCKELELEKFSWVKNIRRIHTMDRLNIEVELARLSVERIFLDRLGNNS